MLIIEYRIPMPYTSEELIKGNYFSDFHFAITENKGGESLTIKTKESFENEIGKGVYTYKIIKTKKVPSWVTYLFPETWLQVHEECWNILDTKGFMKSELRNPFLSKFLIKSTTQIKDGYMEEDNVFLKNNF
jgi:hypothetical protein